MTIFFDKKKKKIKSNLHSFRRRTIVRHCKYFRITSSDKKVSLKKLDLTSCALERMFCPKIAIFSQFQVYSNTTQKAKQIINVSLLNNFSARKRRIIVHGLVTRYGPRTSCQRKGLII